MSEPLWVVIPAAGAGRRFGGEVPKQYLPLAGRGVLEHSLDCFIDHPRVAGVVVALASGDPWWMDSPLSSHPRVWTVTGGRERHESVLNALAAVPADPEPWVAVHDAARPCLAAGDFERLIADLDGVEGGRVLGVPVADTLKHADDRGRVGKTRDRHGIWLAQTPQLFRRNALLRALQACREQGIAVTDEAMAMELQGEVVQMVAGSAHNIKITRAPDLLLAEAVLGAQTRRE